MEKVTLHLLDGGYIEFEKDEFGVRLVASTFRRTSCVISPKKLREILGFVSDFENKKLQNLEQVYRSALIKDREDMEKIIDSAMRTIRETNREKRRELEEKIRDQLDGIYFDEAAAYAAWKRKREIMNMDWVEVE